MLEEVDNLFILLILNCLMYPFSHFLFALFIGEIFVKLNLLNHDLALLVAVIAVLIDLDHFIYYSIKHKDWNLKHAWNAAVSGREKERTFIHFKWGFLIITLLLDRTSRIFLVERLNIAATSLMELPFS